MVQHNISLAENVWVQASDWRVTASRSGGAGGQHVNRTNSKLTLHLPIAHIRGLDSAAQQRLIRLAGDRCHHGVLVIQADEHREQGRNHDELERRLQHLVRRALVVPKSRRPTRPTRGSQERRLATKKARADTKQRRQQRPDVE